VAEDGFAAAGSAGVPERFWGNRGKQFGETLGAIVLDDYFEIGSEVVFDVEAVGEAEGEGGDKFAIDELLADGLFVTGADTEEEIGLVKEREANSTVVDTGGKLILPGEDVGDLKIGAGAGGILLKENNLVLEGQGDLFVPVRAEVV